MDSKKLKITFEDRKSREMRVFDPNKLKITFGDLKTREMRASDPQILQNDRGSKMTPRKNKFIHRNDLFYPIVGGGPGRQKKRKTLRNIAFGPQQT